MNFPGLSVRARLRDDGELYEVMVRDDRRRWYGVLSFDPDLWNSTDATVQRQICEEVGDLVAQYLNSYPADEEPRDA